MPTITVLTPDLQPGDEMVSRESWGTIYDLVTAVELPEAPCVVAKVHIARTRVEGDDVRNDDTFFFAGIAATHEVERPGPPVRTSYPAPVAYTYDADHHCPQCAAGRFGTDAEGYIPEDAEDSEGNPLGAVSPWDEWHQGGEECETLACGDCGAELDTAHADPHSPDCPEWEPDDDDDDPEPAGCDCEGPLHYTTCWWVVHHDDGRDQATGDPAIDDEARARRLAADWHGGQGSALYALASTGTVLAGAAEERQPAPDLAELEAEARARTPWPKTPSMTRCHFEYVARVLAELPTDIVGAAHRRRAIVEHVAGHLADTNGRFDRERFIQAATGR